MKGRIVLVSCLLLLCAGPVLGDDDKKDKENEHKEDADKKSNDELKTLKGKLQKIRVQIKDDKLPQKISEEQISVLKKKLEDFKNLKSEHEAKLASQKGDAAGVSGEQGASGGSGHGEAGPSSPADEQDDDNEAVQWGPATEEVVAEAMSDEGPQEQGAEGGPSSQAANQGEEVAPGPSETAPEASGGQEASNSSNDSAEPTSAAAAAAPAGPTAAAAAAASPQVKHVDTMCDELLAGENKKNVLDEGEDHSQYNNFRKQYDKMVLNKTEYNISLKLLDTMLTNGQVEREKKNTLIKTFKKALYDKQYSEKLRNLISGVYAFAKRNNFIDGNKLKGGDYSKLFEYIGCMMNTLEL